MPQTVFLVFFVLFFIILEENKNALEQRRAWQQLHFCVFVFDCLNANYSWVGEARGMPGTCTIFLYFLFILFLFPRFQMKKNEQKQRKKKKKKKKKR